jgi:uncharacterized protein YbaR (Trm112 family)
MAISILQLESTAFLCPKCDGELYVTPTEPRAGSACPFCREPLWFLRKTVGEVAFLTLLAESKHKSGPSVSCEAMYWSMKNASVAIVDFSRWLEVSNGFLDVLLAVQQKMKASGGLCKLCGLTPQVAEAFRDADLDTVFEIYPDVAAAMENIALSDDEHIATLPLPNAETMSEHAAFAV